MSIGSIIKCPVVTIIGAGSYGTAMAIALSRNGNSVVLWGHKPNHIQALKIHRSNQLNLPDVSFPPSLYLEESLSTALGICQNILVAVPSHVFSVVLMKLKLKLKKNFRIIVASKGLEPKTGRLLQDVTYDVLGNNIPFAVISGPTFARELAIGLPTAIIVASTDTKFSREVQSLLHSSTNLRVYISSDIVGIQIAGAIKNIIAIGSGIADGMGFGANARTALITHGLAEMSRLGVAIGSHADTFVGLAGLGDLVLTCTDNQSRNRRFGILLGKGVNIHRAQSIIGQIVEGVHNTKEVYMLSIRYKVTIPIIEQIYQILYNNKNVHEAVYSLLKRTSSSKVIGN